MIDEYDYEQLSLEQAALREDCPQCGARAGVWCRDIRTLRHHRPLRAERLHVARGWRKRRCPACRALPGQPCATPSGKPARAVHTTRLHAAP